MALFKILKGDYEDLINQPFHEGYMYITKDSADIYVDMVITDSETNQTSNERIQLNANLANALRTLETNGTNTKLNIGSEIQPIYFENGKPKATTYELHKTVPADAKFTDTVYDDTSVKSLINAKYTKPTNGIPKTDLDATVQASLAKVDNAVQSLDGYATKDYVDTAVSDLVNSAPETLNTLDELSKALGDDPNFATTVANQIGQKADASTVTAHTSNADIHVTAANKATWDAKSDFSGNYDDLTNKPTIPTVPTNVSAFTNDAGYITGYTETDPTVPAWAKEASKPSYTASEVGADAAGSASGVQSNLDTHTSNTTVHITAEERTAWTATHDAISDIISTNIYSHNGIFRGKYLGSAVTDAQYAAIADGSFDDMYIGDYWTINDMIYYIAAFNYYLYTGSPAESLCKTNHVVLVPQAIFYKAAMNSTATITGAYVGSEMYTSGLDEAKSIINAAFGEEHILNHRRYLKNATNSYGHETGGSWYDSTVELMTEQNVYGSRMAGNRRLVNASVYPTVFEMDNTQFPLFFYRHPAIRCGSHYWLRTVSGPSHFAMVNWSGASDFASADYERGVRPCFSIIG